MCANFGFAALAGYHSESGIQSCAEQASQWQLRFVVATAAGAASPGTLHGVRSKGPLHAHDVAGAAVDDELYRAARSVGAGEIDALLDVDAVARKIREVAGEHAIPVVENPPLARALHATVDIDQEIPPEHYQAVAEVISYVMRLNRAVARRN